MKIRPNIGITLAPVHGSDADTLLQRASVALEYAAQTEYDYIIYSNKLDKNSKRHLILSNDLSKAIENNELVLHYQPKLDLKNKHISVEALARWNHPEYGLIYPGDFIPLAERTGSIKHVSTWAMNHALKQCAAWQEKGWDLSVAVNISAIDLMDIDLPNKISGQLAYHGIAPQNLVLEITESAVMKDQERALRMLQSINNIGVIISIDDFGSGYSSLAYLSQLPAHEFKIDQSFVKDMLTNRGNNIIVHATIDLGHNLGLKVVAEGVENIETFNLLHELGCDKVQGYHICKPIPAEELEQWLQNPYACLESTAANDKCQRNLFEGPDDAGVVV